jgi:PucR family transcriptional regulator, purine catabolism regulatory protein
VRGPVSIADVLGLPSLEGARVVGGRHGLARPVRAVNVMEVPDIVEWVQADELLLTTAYPLRGDPAALDALVPRLAERGLAGIAVKPVRYIPAIPTAMIEAADRLDFPVIELPADAAFNEIIQAVLTVILDAQAARLERSAAIHDRFTRIVLSGGGLRQIAEALAEFVDRQVWIVDPGGVVLWQTAEQDDRSDVIAQPIQVGGERYGTIEVAPGDPALGPEQLEAIEYAATVAALRQVQARAVAEADRRFQAVSLEELVAGHVTDRGVLMERANAFGWDLATPRAALLAEAASDRPRLVDAARAALGPAAIVWERSDQVAALVPAVDAPGLREAGAALEAEATRRLPGVPVAIGAGRAYPDPLDLHLSFTEARRALAVGRRGHGAWGVTLFGDLGVDRLLVGVADTEIDAYCTAMLGRLEAYDTARGTSLVTTLETYLASRNAAKAARELFVHYNTLADRLDRIEELIGPYLDDPDRCLSLSLALRLRRWPTAYPGARSAGPA